MEQPGITRVSFANDPQPENLCLALIQPDTKERAHVAALAAILTPVTIERRDILIARAAKITVITNADQIPLATEIAGLLKGLRNNIEEDRERLQEPVLAIQRAINSVAGEAKDKAVFEMKRLERLMSDFIAEQERQRQAEQRRRDEEARIQKEAAERTAREAQEAAEKLRKDAEALQAEAASGNSDLFAALDAETRASEAESAAATATAQAATPVFVKQVQEAPKVSGAAVSHGWDFDVTDIAALFAHSPACVELSPRKTVINGIIKAAAQQAGGQTFTIPGLRIYPKANVATRAR